MASWTEAEWQKRRATGLPAWEANQAQADTDYWSRTRENEFFTANPELQKQATLNLQTNAMFNPRSMIPTSYNPFGAGYQNPDTTGPAYPGAPPPNPFPQPAAPTNAMLPPPRPLQAQQQAQPQPGLPMGPYDPVTNPNGWQSSSAQTPGGPLGFMPGDPAGEPGYYPGKPPDPSTGYLPPGTPWPAGTTAPAPFDPTRASSTPVVRATPVDPSTTPAGAPTGGPFNAMVPTSPGNYPGGRGNYMGYGPNGGGNRVDPNYLPENWNYQDSPEFKWQLEQDLRGANRRLLALGRSDSTGGINAMNNLESSLRAAEVDKAYQRAVAANTSNYVRYIGANTTNYGRTVGEDETGWNRATQLDNTGFARQNLLGEQDWNRNYQLANLGYDATRTGVESGNRTGANLANLLSQNGATQANLALTRGDVSAEQIERLMNSGWGFDEIEGLFRRGAPSPLNNLEDPPDDPNFGAGNSIITDPRSQRQFSAAADQRFRDYAFDFFPR